MARVLVIGGDSAIGAALVTAFESSGHEVAATTRRPERVGSTRIRLDLADDARNWPRLEADVAFLCAGETSAARCQADLDTSERVNVEAPAALAARLVSRGTHVCMLSSTQVFDGTRRDYRPGDPTSPTTVYGAQKVRLERRLREIAADTIAVVRLGKVVSPRVALFAQWARALNEGCEVRAVCDANVSPVALSAVVAVLVGVAAKRATGTFHFTASTEMPYSQAAQCIARSLRADSRLVVAEAAQRELGLPAHAMLDSSDTAEAFGLRIPEAEAAFAGFAEHLKDA